MSHLLLRVGCLQRLVGLDLAFLEATADLRRVVLLKVNRRSRVVSHALGMFDDLELLERRVGRFFRWQNLLEKEVAEVS